MLLWRIGANVIPTGENLQRRIQHIDPTCNFCNTKVESNIHLFLECHFARALWTIISWDIRIDTAPLTSGEDIIKLIVNPPNAPIPTNEQWIVTLNMALIIDEIWNSRNLKLFQQEQANLLNAKHHVQARFQEISKVFASTIYPTSRSCSTSWSLPSPDHIKINVNATLNSSKTALAVVAQNHHGKVLFVWGKVHQLCPPLQVEALALLWVVHLAIQNHWCFVMFEEDSKICIDALDHPVQTPRWTLNTIISNIRNLSSYFSSCNFC